jgi:hypothetical protein
MMVVCLVERYVADARATVTNLQVRYCAMSVGYGSRLS